MNQLILKTGGLLLLLLPLACVQTELIPEILEPQLIVSPKSLSLQIGSNTPLSVTFTDAQGEDQSQQVVWKSREPGIVNLSSSGLATGVAVGQTWAIATAPLGLADSVLITVISETNDVARVEIQFAPATLDIGASANLQAKAYNIANQELSNQNFSWSTSNGSILQIDASGKATGFAAGTASITATTSGLNSLPVSIQVLPAGGIKRSGQFSGNSGYSVTGTARLEQTGNTLRLLLESDFMASNGPMLGVYLATSASGGLSMQNSIKIGNLQANSGQQEYAVPTGVGLQDYDYVVIYCIPFTVRFGTAQLSN